MRRSTAQKLVLEFFRAQGVESQGLDENGLGGVTLGPAEIYFEHRGPDRSPLNVQLSKTENDLPLWVHARIYTFKRLPSERLLAELQKSAGELEANACELIFRRENQSLFWSRSYSKPVSIARFTDDLEQLAQESVGWLDGRLEACIERTRRSSKAN